MKFSIVTISYNQCNFIENTITSIVNQDYKNIEYIVVDAGSDDGSRDIIYKYHDRIKKIVFETDSGPADGLNRGFGHATGDIFGFINADDELIPNALSTVSQFFRTHPKVDVVSGCGYFIDSEGFYLRRIVPSKFNTWLYVHGGVSVFQQGTFFRASYFKKVGGFNIINKTCWDGELFLDMAMAGAKFATIGDDLAYFRLHEAGITGSGRLSHQYRLDSERLFIKATGRQPTSFDVIQGILARTIKGILDPMYYIRRLVSLI